jgi:protein-S-isoprenylcysteine O-methyltransferase Ste14
MPFIKKAGKEAVMYLLLNLVMTLILSVFAAGVISGLAGHWDLWNVWAYAGILLVLWSLQTLVLYRKSPDLLKERVKPPPGGRVRWTSARASLVGFILQWITAGLDQRFHWSDVVPPAGMVAGLVVFAIGWGLMTWSVLVNPFFSPVTRIQAEREQWVISAGPYRIVRHPGYAGTLLFVVAGGVALNSLVSIIPIVVIVLPITVYQTMVEDQMLRDELAGYADYAAKVRYRLIPGVW